MLNDTPPTQVIAEPPEQTGPAPDPGSPYAALVAWVLGTVLVAAVFLVNQLGGPPPAPANPNPLSIPAFDPFTFNAKAAVRLTSLSAYDQAAKAAAMGNIDPAAVTPLQKLRAALCAGEIVGPEEAEKRLKDLAENPDTPQETKDLIPVALKAVKDASALSSEERENLKRQHGWFGELALSRGLPETDPLRVQVMAGVAWLVLLLIFAIGAAIIAVLGALAGIVILSVMFARGKLKPHFVPPGPGGSVYLEMIPVFVACFLLFKMSAPLIIAAIAGVAPGAEMPRWALTAQLGAQWSLIVVIFYPLLRGVTWSRMRQDLGWHSGRGILREIGAGLVAYFAGLPLLVIAALISYLAIVVRTIASPNAPPPENPILDLALHASVFDLLVLFTLATIWAPLVEETLFRGAFFRHLRSRVHFIVAAIISAIAFGVMHGYESFLLLPVMTLGFVFALIREWRGSLIGSMVAHGLHNATILSLLFLALASMR